MQGGHKPFYVAISFSPKHYLMCSRFCLVWTQLLSIMEIRCVCLVICCVSLNLVTCVFYLNENIIVHVKYFIKKLNYLGFTSTVILYTRDDDARV